MNTSKNGKKYPLFALRQMSSSPKDPQFIKMLFEHCDKYPGTIDEIWFASANWTDIRDFKDLEAHSKSLLPLVDECHKRNIRFALQNMVLGHTIKDTPPPGYPFDETSWMVTCEGETAYGVLCPSAPEVHEFMYEYAKTVLNILKPDAFWPDDDLRLAARETHVCFCERCIKLYNEKNNRSFTRQELVQKLFGEEPDAQEIRTEWVIFNNRNLAAVANAIRKAVDEVHPACDLGLQRTRSTKNYDAFGCKEMYQALAGKDNKFFAFRSGGGFYTDLFPRDMVRKCFDVGRAAAEIKSLGFDCAVCIEGENYPHISVQKSPGTLMTESAMSISAGADFTSLYWHGLENREPVENYEFFMQTCALHRPFIEAVRDTTLETLPGGCAVYTGWDALAHHDWLGVTDDTEERMSNNSVPMTVPGSAEEVYVVNERSARSMTNHDLSRCFAKPVLMDIAGFEVLAKKFPNAPFVSKVKLSKPDFEFSVITNSASELYGENCKADTVFKSITKLSHDVQIVSRICGVDAPATGGTAIIPSGFGGSIVLVQFLNIWHGWTTYRRENILDALDKVIPGRMSARLLTSGYSVYMHSYRDKDGKTSGAFLLNGALGDTPALRIALRNVSGEKFRLYRQKLDPIDLVPAEINGSELIFELPPLEPWRAMMIGIVK